MPMYCCVYLPSRIWCAFVQILSNGKAAVLSPLQPARKAAWLSNLAWPVCTAPSHIAAFNLLLEQLPTNVCWELLQQQAECSNLTMVLVNQVVATTRNAHAVVLEG